MEIAHRLINTRGGTAMLAVVTAIAAAALVLVYVNRYRAGVQADATPATVLVAQHAIAKGTAGEVILSRSLFGTERLRGDETLSGAFVDASALRGKVATRDIAAGEQLTAAAFGSGVSTLSAKLTGTQRAIAVPIDSARGLIGRIEAGDHVDVLAGFNVQGALTGLGRPVVKLVLQNVPVLAITNRGTTSTSATTQSATVTLQVTDLQAAKLAYTTDNGKLWFVLRPRAGAPLTNTSAVSVEALLGTAPVR